MAEHLCAQANRGPLLAPQDPPVAVSASCRGPTPLESRVETSIYRKMQYETWQFTLIPSIRVLHRGP